MSRALTYSVITPARNEAHNLRRLADSLARQTVLPREWIVADDGSTDDSESVVADLGATHSWVKIIDARAHATRGPVSLEAGRHRGSEVTAFVAGVAELASAPDVVVKIDADISMGTDFFERLLSEFERDPRLGIASGSAFELVDGRWQQRHVTGSSVWGASRAYRWSCLGDVSPLEERLAWDGIDEAKARARGWKTRTLTDLPFLHHRIEGERDRSRWRRWAEVGRSSHYLHYRVPYLLARTLHQARSDPAAFAILWGFAASALRREPQLADRAARIVVREDQRLRHLPRRWGEALGRRKAERVAPRPTRQ